MKNLILAAATTFLAACATPAAETRNDEFENFSFRRGPGISEVEKEVVNSVKARCAIVLSTDDINLPPDDTLGPYPSDFPTAQCITDAVTTVSDKCTTIVTPHYRDAVLKTENPEYLVFIDCRATKPLQR